MAQSCYRLSRYTLWMALSTMVFLQVGHFFCAFTAALMHGSQKTCLHSHESISATSPVCSALQAASHCSCVWWPSCAAFSWECRAAAHPQGPQAIAVMLSIHTGHCGSDASADGFGTSTCFGMAGTLCLCSFGCTMSANASSGECDVRSMTASLCWMGACREEQDL